MPKAREAAVERVVADRVRPAAVVDVALERGGAAVPRHPRVRVLRPTTAHRRRLLQRRVVGRGAGRAEGDRLPLGLVKYIVLTTTRTRGDTRAPSSL